VTAPGADAPPPGDPAAAPPAPPQYPYDAAPGWPAPPYTPPARTNSLAVVSLVAGCAQMFLFVVASVVAVVTGHIARHQIKRTGEHGAGMALAGLVLGYLGLAFLVTGVAALLVFVFGFSSSVAQHSARDDARSLGRAIVREVALEERSPRDPQLLLRVYVKEVASEAGGGCCNSAHVRLADGTRFEDATLADWRRVGWRIEVARTIFYTRDACLTVPVSGSAGAAVVDGPCLP